MIDPASRYAQLSVTPLSWTDPSGRDIRYVGRRFLAPASSFETLGQVVVQANDRIDLVAYRTLGSADAWWRIADAAEAIDPRTLTAQPGATLTIPVPRA